jgi:hypothetical protein
MHKAAVLALGFFGEKIFGKFVFPPLQKENSMV